MTMQGVSAGTIITSTGLGSNSNLSAMGSKRGRLLIRQQRIKKDNDQSNTGDLETPEASAYTEYLLPVPTAKMERHASEPSPATSQLISSPSTSSQNLLSVPQHSYLIKQHSHPLLPSQSQSPPTYTLQRQLSHPLQTTSTITQSTMTVQQSQQQQQQMHLVAQQKQQVHHQSAPSLITQQQVQQHQQQLSQFSSAKSESHDSEMGSVVQIQGHRTTHQMSNPTVVIIPEIVSVSQGTELQQHTPQPQSQQHLQLPSIRVKSEELQRSVSSPLTSTRELSLEGARSSHCPVVRPGPALGCNFCWNTIDAHGRILRRKTKYHCPECQTNLCIVPCFQEYHERQSSENLSGNESTTTNNKASSLKHHPKAGSM